jgi:hypothetical protein
MRRSGTRRVAKRALESSLTDACLCATCRRPMLNEVKHCVLDRENGSLILCDSCYLLDERRYDWEHRGNPFPQRRALSHAR